MKKKWVVLILLTVMITVMSAAFVLNVSRSTDDYLSKVRSDWNKYCYLSKNEKKCEGSQDEFKSFIPSFIQLKYLEYRLKAHVGLLKEQLGQDVKIRINIYLSDPDLENLRKSEKNAEILKMFKL